MANTNKNTSDSLSGILNQVSELTFGEDIAQAPTENDTESILASQEKVKLQNEREAFELEKKELEKQKADFEKQRLEALVKEQAEKQAKIDTETLLPAKNKVEPKKYKDLEHSDLVVIEFDHEVTTTNRKGDFEVVKGSVTKVLPKSYWDSLDKDKKGYPIYVNASLEGIAVLNEKGEHVDTVDFL